MPRGGYYEHKPDCPCPRCTYRRRAEANASGAGEGREVLEPEEPKSEEDKGLATIHVDEILATPTLEGRRRWVMDWVKLRMDDPEITFKDAAQAIGINYRTLNRAINTATKEGWLKFDDPIERLEHSIIPKTLDNMEYYLKKRDKVVTIEAFKHTIAKDYQEAHGTNQPNQNILALRIETVPTIGQKIVTGTVVGTPRLIVDAETIKE